MNDAASSPFVLKTRDARGVVTLTLNRPASFNALSEGMLGALEQAIAEIAADESVRAVVIAAAGKAFCAGHDLKEMRAEPSLGYYQQLFERCGAMMLSIQRLPVPVIARVHGIATAAGCQLVAVCDLAVASSEARFAVSGVNVGLFCATPSVTLSRNLGRKEAFEMLVTGEFIDAQEARQKGLVNRVAAPAELDAAVETLVASIVAKPRKALALGKALFYRRPGRREPDDGLQHDGRERARRRSGLHRETPARLEALSPRLGVVQPRALRQVRHQEFHLVRQDAAVSQNEIFPKAGHIGRIQERHVGLLGRAAALAVVARLARCDHVHPGVDALLRERNDVLARELVFVEMPAAVGADVAVPRKKLAVGKPRALGKGVNARHALGADDAVDGNLRLLARDGVVSPAEHSHLRAHLPADFVRCIVDDRLFERYP
jgi:enoyl-CoA hydratase/carnithine racemase